MHRILFSNLSGWRASSIKDLCRVGSIIKDLGKASPFKKTGRGMFEANT